MKNYNKYNNGFTLLEVLVSVVILSVGLLGLTILQTQGLKDNLDAYLRSQATFSIYDMSDRIKANRDFWLDQVVNDPAFPNTLDTLVNSASGATTANHLFCNTDDPPAGSAAGDTPIVCTPQQMAEYDVYRWFNNLNGILPRVDDQIDAGSITRITDPNDTSNVNIIQLRIDWVRANQGLGNMAAPFIELNVRL